MGWFTVHLVQYHRKGDSLHIHQSEFIERRCEDVPPQRELQPHDFCSYEDTIDNQSTIGAVSWVVHQTRPDEAAVCAVMQKRRKRPTQADIRACAKCVSNFNKHPEIGITIKPIPLEDVVLLVFHDPPSPTSRGMRHNGCQGPP